MDAEQGLAAADLLLRATALNSLPWCRTSPTGPNLPYWSPATCLPAPWSFQIPLSLPPCFFLTSAARLSTHLPACSLTVAWAGDCRAVVGLSIPTAEGPRCLVHALTQDHKPGRCGGVGWAGLARSGGMDWLGQGQPAGLPRLPRCRLSGGLVNQQEHLMGSVSPVTQCRSVSWAPLAHSCGVSCCIPGSPTHPPTSHPPIHLPPPSPSLTVAALLSAHASRPPAGGAWFSRSRGGRTA